jgi:L-amino acid N-acyltransferase YncA
MTLGIALMEKHPVIIRASAEADVDAIATIYEHYVLNSTVTFETEAPSLQEMLRRRSILVAARFPYLVAEINGQVVGYAYAGTYRARAAYRSTVENSVYLGQDAVGKGIGRQLLETLIAACEVTGFRQMIAVIGGKTNNASVRLHERCGFRHVGTLESVGFKHGEWLPTILMQRELRPGNLLPPSVVG